MSKTLPTAVNTSRSADGESKIIEVTISESTLISINESVIANENIDIHGLARNRPRDAFVWLQRIWEDKFPDPYSQGWDVGSAEEDGQLAFDGLRRYVEEISPPNPDIDELEIIISIWKRGSIMDFLRGNRYVPREVINFKLVPPNLAGYSA